MNLVAASADAGPPRTARPATGALALAGRARTLRGVHLVVLLACAATALGRLLLGVLAETAARSASVGDLVGRAAERQAWARAVLVAAAHREPTAQMVVDYAVSALALGLAVVLLVRGRHAWWPRLLGLAMIGLAGTTNLSVRATAASVQRAIGLPVASVTDASLAAVTFAAFWLAMLTFPARARGQPIPAVPRHLLTAGAGALVAAAAIATVLPAAASTVVLFAFAVPVAGLLALRLRRANVVTAEQRTQLRLLLGVLIATTAIAALLTVISVALWSTGWRGLTLLDPATSGVQGPLWNSALLFWFARCAAPAVAGCALVATRSSGVFTVERRFSHGLLVALVATQIGGVFVIVRTSLYQLWDADSPTFGTAITAVAAVPAALVFFPLYVRVERWIDRLLYGVRPTPYSVLAGIGAQVSPGTADAPHLSRVVEAVGQGLGAQVCRLTVERPGLGAREYAWHAGEVADDVELVEVPIRLGDEQIGSLTVDRPALAGARAHHQHFLRDIADSLGAVVQASRLGIELERQLRAARALGSDIARSRRRLVAEMDAERRRIERDLHDGAQHHLVSLQLSLGLVEHLVGTGAADRARTSLAQIAEEIDVIDEILAQTATGVSSPALVGRGLVDALAEELAAGQPAVAFDAGAVASGRRFPADVESAVWFCCLEAVGNARKHAPGAAVEVALEVTADRLRFSVRDDGPGWDPAARDGSPGRGIRNVIARAFAAGGYAVVRAAPGAGTVVEGWLPLPDAPPDAVPDQPTDEPALPAPAGDTSVVPNSLAAEVRDVLQAAARLYAEGSPAARRVRELTERMNRPLQVGVLGPAGAGTSTLVQVLTRLAAPAIRVHEGDAAQDGGADVHVVLLVGNGSGGASRPPAVPDHGDPYRRVRTLAVVDVDPQLPGDAPADVAARCAAQASDLCRVVVPLAGLPAMAALTLDMPLYQGIVRVAENGAADAPVDGELRTRLGDAGARLAVAIVRAGRAPSPEALAQALRDESGLERLQALVRTRFVARAAPLKAWAALGELDALVRADPPTDADALTRRLERIRANVHELAEIDAIDAVRSGGLGLTGEEIEAAARLLGESGPDPRTRLGLPQDAEPADVVATATRALAVWRRHATHPAAGRTLRDVAIAVVRSCEQVLDPQVLEGV